MENQCAICDIIQRNKESHIIYEDDFFISFLDIHPLFLGHSLLAPKKHFATIYDLPNSYGNEFLSTIQKIGNAITQAMHAEGTFIAINTIVSQSIPHLHVHLIPRKKGDGLKGFFWPRIKYENEQELLKVQRAIRNEIYPVGI